MTDNEWFTVSEASEKVNIPVETIRRYLRSHSVHMKAKKMGKKYYIHSESVTVIQQIRALYEQNKNVEEVEEALSNMGVPLTITVKNDDEVMTVHVADELQEIKKKLEQQEKFNDDLLEQMKKQQEYIEKSLERRDQQLMESIRGIQETKQAQLEVAFSSQEQQEIKRGFWSRIFSFNK